MQNKKITIILLVIAIALLAYIAFKPKGPTVVTQNQELNDSQVPTGDTSNEKDTPNSYNNIATLDLSDTYTKTYKTVFAEALKKPADFNGHYVVASYGCGSGCVAYGIVDKTTGKAYKGPSDDYGGNYQVPTNFNATRYSLNSNLFKVVGYTEIETYKFENNKFILVN